MKKLVVLLLTTALLFIAANASATLMVTNLSAQSGSAYEIGSLSVGSTYYTDRTYTITNQPAGFDSYVAIKTANNDKNYTGDNFLTFDVNESTRVYLAYDSRAVLLPSWLSGWESTGQIIQTTDVPLNVFTEDFEAGTIALGANQGGNVNVAECGTQAKSMYLVYLDANAGDSNSVPEPSIMLLLGSGLVGVAVFRRKFRKKLHSPHPCR